MILDFLPKAGVGATIQQLAQLGVALKVITGDNRAVAAHLSQQCVDRIQKK